MDSNALSTDTQPSSDPRFPPATGADLKVRFVGGINGVTGSCAWLHHEPSDAQILIDCGIYQGDSREKLYNQAPFPFDPRAIRCVLLTHAHLDHCGLLPRLVKEGFCGLVYATAATCSLAKLMLADAAKLNPDLSSDLVDRINWSVFDADEGFKWGRAITIVDGLVFCAKRSSHVLGACAFTVNWKPTGNDTSNEWRGICFSGDVGRSTETVLSSLLLKHGQKPFASTPYIVLEATYGDRVRNAKFDNISERLSALARIIGATKEQGGTAFFPAFALHRSQEVLIDILCAGRMNHLDPLRIAIHSPLAQSLTKIYAHHLLGLSPNGKKKYFNEECLGWLGAEEADFLVFLKMLAAHGTAKLNGLAVEFVSGPVVEQRHYDVVVASSGMCDFGAAAEYLKSLADDARNAVVFTGYQASTSAGRKFLEHAEAGKGCMIEDLSPFFSGHADQAGLLDFVFALDGYPQLGASRVLINHGEPKAKQALQKALRERSLLLNPGDRKVESVKLANARWLNLD